MDPVSPGRNLAELLHLEMGLFVVIPSSEWGIFCYAHTVDGKKTRPRRKDFVAFLY